MSKDTEWAKPTNAKELRELASDGKELNCILQLGSGYSRKEIRLTEAGKFSVLNCIDDTRQTLTDNGLRRDSNIAEAMSVGAFFVEI